MYANAHIRSLRRERTQASWKRLAAGFMKAPLKAVFPAVLATTVALSGCYVVPLSPDGPSYPAYPYSGYPGAVPPVTPPAPPAAQVLSVRLYPANEKATQSGVLSGTVTSTSIGKGRFQLNYRGETLNGEATRVDGDSRRGVASAYGSSGAFMSCEYQMQSTRQGAGTCTLSDGARYQVHIGS